MQLKRRVQIIEFKVTSTDGGEGVVVNKGCLEDVIIYLI